MNVGDALFLLVVAANECWWCIVVCWLWQLMNVGGVLLLDVTEKEMLVMHCCWL
jgi:hypothetical protein